MKVGSTFETSPFNTTANPETPAHLFWNQEQKCRDPHFQLDGPGYQNVWNQEEKKAGTLSFPRRRVEERPGFMSDDTTHSWCTVGLEQVYRCTFPARFYTSVTSVAEVARGKIRPDLPSLCPVLSLTNQQIRRGLNTRPYCSKGFEKCVNIMKLFFLTLDPLGILQLTTN